MTKFILIGGHIYKASDGGKAFCDEVVKGIEHRPVKILDCLFARDPGDWEKRFEEDKEFFAQHIDHFLFELAIPEHFLDQVRDADVIFFQGGYPANLLALLRVSGDWTMELDGKVVIGSSGGADALCKYYGVGKTGRIGEGLGLLPIKFIPHWKSDSYSAGIDIDWDALHAKLKSHNEELEIVVATDGEFVVIEQ